MNTAQQVLRNIGGTAAIIAAGWNKHVAPVVEKKERIAQPLRSYHKQYRNTIAEYIIGKRRAQAEADKAVAA